MIQWRAGSAQLPPTVSESINSDTFSDLGHKKARAVAFRHSTRASSLATKNGGPQLTPAWPLRKPLGR